MLEIEALGDEESEGDRVEDIVMDTDNVGVIAPLTLTLGDVVLDKQWVGVSDWVEDELTVTVPLNVSDTLLLPDTEALAEGLTLWEEVIVPEGLMDDDTLEDGELEGEVVPVKQREGEAELVEEVLNVIERLPDGDPERVAY